jgi:prophage antirepressor-like protein
MEQQELVQAVGKITFGNRLLTVYSSLDEPLFRVSDIGDILDYSRGNAWTLANLCEEDEKLNLTIVVGGQRRAVVFVTETGLYNILAQSRVPLARLWRRIISEELIQMRREKGRNIVEQFDEWDHKLDDLYFDEDSGMLMRSVTLPGGDVIQQPFS